MSKRATRVRQVGALIAWLVLAAGAVGCGAASSTAPASGIEKAALTDPLPSWRDGELKNEIRRFVDAVTDRSSPMFRPRDQRIAVFDLDGTLVMEKPDYVEVVVAAEALRSRVKEDPSLAQRQPFKAAVENDEVYIRQHAEEAILAAAEGVRLARFESDVSEFLNRGVHPLTKRSYLALFYKPMLELVHFLRQRGFEVLVVSTSQQEYIRVLAHACLGIPRANVIGSMVQFRVVEDPPHLLLVREAEWWEPHNERMGKVQRIRERTGGLPIFAVGNSSGDLEMLRVTDFRNRGMVMVIDHDDKTREMVEYHKQELLDEAVRNGWQIVSMKKNWSEVFGDACELN